MPLQSSQGSHLRPHSPGRHAGHGGVGLGGPRLRYSVEEERVAELLHLGGDRQLSLQSKIERLQGSPVEGSHRTFKQSFI